VPCTCATPSGGPTTPAPPPFAGKPPTPSPPFISMNKNNKKTLQTRSIHLVHHKFDSIYNTSTNTKNTSTHSNLLCICITRKNQKNCSHEPRALEATPCVAGFFYRSLPQWQPRLLFLPRRHGNGTDWWKQLRFKKVKFKLK
jgi:hypothetical protein